MASNCLLKICKKAKLMLVKWLVRKSMNCLGELKEMCCYCLQCNTFICLHTAIKYQLCAILTDKVAVKLCKVPRTLCIFACIRYIIS